LADAAIPNVAQQGCIQSLYSAWAATLCPSYGVAFLGFQQTLVDTIEQTCSAAGCIPTFPWDFYAGVQLVWPDDTPYALGGLAVVGVQGVTGQFESENNFYEAVDVQSARSGVEVVVVQARNWTNFTMDLNDAKWILSDPLAQQSVTSYFYSYLDIIDVDYYCGSFEIIGGNKKRQKEFGGFYFEIPPIPRFAGTPGVVVQVSGVHFTNNTNNYVDVSAPYVNFEFTIADSIIAGYDSNEGYFDPVGNFTAAPFLGIFYTPGTGMQRIAVNINYSPIGDPYYAPSRTYTTAPEVAWVSCFFGGGKK
jgi:hypothetical protein